MPVDESPDYSILAELGYGDRIVALVRDEHPADPNMTRLGWSIGLTRRVADDMTTPDEAVGKVVDAPRTVSGIQTFIEGPVTVVEGIERYSELLVARVRDTLRELRERADDPGEIVRNIEQYGAASSPLKMREPNSVTDDEGREQAAIEIIRHSVGALFTLPVYGTLLGPAQRFYRQIEEAVALYPTVTLQLLYEDGRERRGWPA